MTTCFDIASAVSAFVAAALWFWSAKTKISSSPPVVLANSFGAETARVASSQQQDAFLSAVIKQSKLSAWAAGCAAFAAAFQAIAIVIRLFSN